MRARSVVLTWGLLTALLGAGYGVLFTMLDDYRDQYGIAESRLGAIIAIGFLAGFLAQLFIAPLADRGHARRLVFGGVLLNVVGLLMMAMSKSFLPLAFGRLVMGIGIGTAVPAVRRIVILADPQQMGANLGRLMAMDVGGFATGPAVSALVVGPLGIAAPFLLIAGLTIVAVVVVSRMRVADVAEGHATQRLALDLLRLRPFLGAVVFGAALYMMIGAFDSLWAVTLDDLHAGDWISNLGISLFALPLVVLGPIGGRLAQRVGPFRLASSGLLVGALAMVLYGRMPSGGSMLGVAMVHSLLDGLSVSSAAVAAGFAAPAERQAGGQGVLGAVETLTAGCTAVVAGALYEHQGRTFAFTAGALAMLVLIATGVWLSYPQILRSPEPVPA